MSAGARPGGIWIDGAYVVPTMLTLKPREVALLLGIDERSVRELVRHGVLQDVSRDAVLRLGVEDVVRLVDERIAAGELTPLVRCVLIRVLTGRLHVPRARRAGGRPPSLVDLALASGSDGARRCDSDSLHRSTDTPRSRRRPAISDSDAT